LDTNQAIAHAVGLHRAGRLAEAEVIYRQVLTEDPDHVDGLHLLGVIANAVGRNEEAVNLIGKAIARDDCVPDFHCNIGNALAALGRTAEMEAHFRRAISLNPDHPEANNNLGNALKEQGRLAEAEGHFRRALAVRPDYAEAHYNLGNVFLALGRTEEAVQYYNRAIALRPEMATAHYNLGHVLKDQGKLVEAVEAYRRALAIQPDWADALNNLGSVLYDLDRLTEAEASFRQALANRPENATALANLAATLRPSGRIDEAIACMRRALELDPDSAAHYTNFIFALNFVSDATAADHQAERACYHARHAARYAGSIRPHPNRPDPQRRLRIGYVSAHFRDQAATFAFAGVITNHDREPFEIICYSDAPQEDAVSERLRACSDRWHRTANLSDDELAQLIRSDETDILVDLVGHMSGHRLLVFARKPAPIQMTGWGEPTGTGLKTMDYLLADPVLVPATERHLLAEKVVDLPNFLGFWIPEPLPEVSPLPALARGRVTFGSFNRLDKMQDPVVRIWARILNALPGSRLILKNRWLGEPVQRDRIMALFSASGVAPERVQLLGSSSRLGHFSGYHEIDIALDTFPHGGGMTTLDALWMGVPVVTSPGVTISSRLAAASLTAAGLTEFIAADLDGYVELAVAKAHDLSTLAELRLGLRQRMNASAFGDGVQYARAVEARYREMWGRWCAKQIEGGVGATRAPFANG
jgi:predicted O-linked N-acetylglucosamine transferase (SPINDLY family)